MKRTFDGNFILLGLLSFCVFVFYLFFVNLSIDTIILFLSNKIFLGKWLAQGVFPWFNPHIFLGTPFAFDIGLGNLHPFNLFFLLPYPYSFAVWVCATTFLFLSGFYLFFRDFTKTKQFALLLSVILFFTGSGLFRINNPTIYIVIAHAGWFLWVQQFIKSRPLLYYIMGTFLLISGHFQFVVYVLILSVYGAYKWYKIRSVDIIRSNTLLVLINLPHLFFSLPIILESTRMTLSKDYVTVGSNSGYHLIQVILPYILGQLSQGSKWLSVPTYTVLSPMTFTLVLIILISKKKFLEYSVLLFLIVASLGFVNIPFLRNAGQVMVLFHIFGLQLIAQCELNFFKILKKIGLFRFWTLLIGIFFITCSVVSYSHFFTKVITLTFQLVGKERGLFYDDRTITAIGVLVGNSFFHLGLFICFISLCFSIKNKLVIVYSLLLFTLFEGVVLQYAFNFYIPNSVLLTSQKTPRLLNTYRVQSTPDVIPYHGIAFYMSDVILQPPFSKEIPYVDSNEKKSFQKLTKLFNLFPSTWIMTYEGFSIQGFNTFIPKDLVKFFESNSQDYQTEYKYIIDRNPLFDADVKTTSINGIETSKITLYDPRWEKLGVRYFISDRPLKKYKLIENKNGRYIYENEWASPMYRVVMGDTMTAKRPIYQNPNEWHFDIGFTEKGSNFEMIMNPGGFVATINGKPVAVQKGTFLLRVPLTREGKLILRYSPVQHLKETIEAKL